MALTTLEHARKMYALWCEAEEKLASGAVKSYQIGSRSLTYLDLGMIQAQKDYWARMIGTLEGTYSARYSRQAVPRDL